MTEPHRDAWKTCSISINLPSFPPPSHMIGGGDKSPTTSKLLPPLPQPPGNKPPQQRQPSAALPLALRAPCRSRPCLAGWHRPARPLGMPPRADGDIPASCTHQTQRVQTSGTHRGCLGFGSVPKPMLSTKASPSRPLSAARLMLTSPSAASTLCHRTAL